MAEANNANRRARENSLVDGLDDAAPDTVDGISVFGAAVDDANRAIIEALQRDGRRAYGSIADEIGLSEAAVRRRVQRMRDAGVIQIVAVADPALVGFQRSAMVGIRTEGDTRIVADKLAAIDLVDYVVLCSGSFDLIVEVVCHSDDHLVEVVNGSIRSIPGVQHAEIFVYLKIAKQTYSWGSR